MFAPANSDRVDRSRGSYSLLRRSGRTEGRGDVKVESAMFRRRLGSNAEEIPSGLARDIAPEGYAHPVYRAGSRLRCLYQSGSPALWLFSASLSLSPHPSLSLFVSSLQM